MATRQDDAGSAVPNRTAGLSLTRRSAGLALILERVWPTLFASSAIVAVFFVLSWFGIFAASPWPVRVALLAGLCGGIGIVLWRARAVRLPSVAEIDQRIEAESRLDHQPLQAQVDRPTNTDPFAAALWREHQRRMAERLKNLSGGAPRTRTERLDPLGLRALLAMLLVTGFAFSYGSGGGRVSDAFVMSEAAVAVSARVDAWVTPPSYTGRAPIFLTDAAVAGEARGPVEVPEGSVLSVRVSDGSDTKLTFTPTGGSAEIIEPGPLKEVATPEGGDAATPDGPSTLAASPGAAQAVETTDRQGENAVSVATAPADGTDSPTSAGVFEFRLTADGSADLSTTFRSLGRWTFAVMPDVEPIVAFVGEPAEARNAALELSYSVDDDYGVPRGRAEIVVKDEVAPGARALVAAPEITLAMPRRTKGEAKGRTSSDLTDSPYAGARIEMRLTGTDDAGQVGRSEPKTFTLPQRRFTNPLARAVVEQRRILALDANTAPRVVEMLDAVTLRGEDFIANPSDYLALRAVRERIDGASNDEALLSAVDFLWEIALGIEDGNLSLAERKLRDARENLAEALEKGASDEEIDKLMAELREAMQEYMQALAEAMQNQPPMSQEDMANAQEIRPSDLERMMDQIEDLAKSGSKEAAQQLLSELQRMMDNMQAMKPGQPQQGGEQNAMREQMDKLGELLRKQQELKDQTYDLGRQQMQREQGEQGEPQQGQQGEQGEPGESGEQQQMTAEELQKRLDELKAQQGQLQKELQEFQEAMKGMGMQPGEGFGEAGEAMGEAESALGEGDDGEAVGRQSQAMDALRKGAQDMMQQMQEAMNQGQGPGQQPGQGQMGEGFGRGEQRSGRDPLGRQRATQGTDLGQDVEVPDEIDTQRARRILDAIRNRLGDTLSPQLEREYLERLLQTP